MNSVLIMTMVLAHGSKPADFLPNSSFESGDGTPDRWEAQTWQGEGEFIYADTGRTGSRSVAVASETGGDVAWTTKVSIEPFATYRLSGWIKTEGVDAGSGKGALLNLHNLPPIQTAAIVGTTDWSRVEVEFETGDMDEIQVNCLLGGWGLATGKTWFDDLRLELVRIAELEPAIRIDATKTGPAISKYIYGQFIEHLGRCIYGGIWAEMLEDRKFFYPVGSEESPWAPVLKPDSNASPSHESCCMTQDDPYVGDHDPKITIPAGCETCCIRQEGFAIETGKEYVGRIVLSGEMEGERPIQVSLAWGSGENERDTVAIDDLSGSYRTYPLRFKAGADSGNAAIEIVGRPTGWFRIGAVSLMPADNIHGMRRDTLALLEELDSPVYRWPGGNFVSGYDWRDGIGDPDKRPPRKNPAWRGIEHNDFGIDEFMVFCREVGAEPLVVVNSGLGDLDMALGELEYANGAPDSSMGKLRAANGHPQPYNVTWWGVGNEMYGGWQLGHMPLEEYARKHNEFAEAMRRLDANVKLIAVGATGVWSETMLAQCADHMDLLSEHFYCGEVPGLMSHVRQIPNHVRHKAEAHRRYHETLESLSGRLIPIALDEWNYWYGPERYGEIGVRYYLRDALGIAAGIHEMSRHSDVFFMANYAQTVNVIGCIKTSKTDACFATTGLALKLYRRQFGATPVEVANDAHPLDVAAAWTDDRTAITIGVVNPTKRSFAVPLDVAGTSLTGGGRRWTIAGQDAMAFNEPGKPPQVTIQETEVEGVPQTLETPPVSVCLYRLNAQ